MRSYFITGTDTDVGKTVVAASLLRYFNAKGLSTVGFKPISAGCSVTEHGLINDDAEQLRRLSSICLPYARVNPYAFEPPIAPHIAAKMVGETITGSGLSEHYQNVLSAGADVVVVEGAGGWYLPINEHEYLCDWVSQTSLEVILVVGIKLGCLNHALLTQAVMAAQGIKLVGWVANIIAPQTLHIDANIELLQKAIKAPLLATIPHLSCNNSAELEIDFAL